MERRSSLVLATTALITLSTFAACSSTKGSGFGDSDGGNNGPDSAGSSFGGGSDAGKDLNGDPVTCQDAADFHTYVGCDYWPTVTANLVDSVFDFAVVVANNSQEDANITVTGPQGTNQKVKVKGGGLEKVYLPWVPALKGADNDGIDASVLVKQGAFHLVSDIPVVVYQFNPLEFQAKGGPPGKNWSSCVPGSLSGVCYSYSNDASLLLPSTAMTGNYRIMGPTGWTRPSVVTMPAYFVVTGTQDGTNVEVKLSSKGQVTGGSGIANTAAGGTLKFTLNAGDVAEVVGGSGNTFDLSGSLLTANHPVQVITGVACADYPTGVQACDHVEEALFPAETLGKHYVIARPSSPKQNVGHVVRIFGNIDGTTLTYKPSKPAGCPASINAGVVADCGQVTTDFEVTGSNEFGVATFQLGGELVDPGALEPMGDPSQSFAVGVEQFRKKYVFLAPADYKFNFVDIVAPQGATITIDGKDVSGELKALSGTEYFVGHVALQVGANNGAHVLESSVPVGIQVLGYGENTTYQYPGGLNLAVIAAPPPK
ncbi:MAG: IgGFc-binding protein [Polyangiaceae bacterium]